ncbi:MAG: MFS transporter, partial [Desulfobulbaceae bacterium]|nr:MFS transporter [Desulfobulbaceae bacterium]
MLPGVVAVAVLLLFVGEPAPSAPGPWRPPVRGRELLRLGRKFWLVAGVGILFSLARFSEAFVLLRARDAGMSIHLVPFILVFMNIFYALGAYPAGHLSDRAGRAGLLAAGLAALVGADLLLALATGWVAVAAGAALWGVHLAFTQGLFAALVADSVAGDVRSTAFG